MVKENRALQILMIVVIGVGIQFLFILLGTNPVHDSPNHGAAAFARAYFQKDPQVSDRICQAQFADATYDIGDHIRNTAKEAGARGFDKRFMASILYQVKTETKYISDTEATVRITAKRKTAINPLYFLVAVIFNLGETHTVDDTLTMTKESDQWKVCNRFSTVFQSI